MSPTIGEPKILLPRQITRGSVIFVRAMLSHPMYTGMSRDAAGHLVPAYFVKEVVVTYAGERIARFQWTSGISQDPYVEFPVRADRAAPIAITWRDTHGREFRQSADVTFTE